MRFKNRGRRWAAQTLAVAASIAGGALVLGCGAAQTQTVTIQVAEQRALQLQPPQGDAVALAELLPRAKATVLVFWAAGCPCVRRYQERSDDLRARWQARGVQVLGVAANADETLAEVESARRERGFALPVWRDRGGELARALGVKTTPTAVVMLADGTVAYRGWIDNERLPGAPERQAWLDEALERIAAGDRTPQTRPTWGCRITQGAAQAEPDAGVASQSASSCGCKVVHPAVQPAVFPAGPATATAH